MIAGVAGWRRCSGVAMLVIPDVMAVCISIIDVIEPDDYEFESLRARHRYTLSPIPCIAACERGPPSRRAAAQYASMMPAISISQLRAGATGS